MFNGSSAGFHVSTKEGATDAVNLAATISDDDVDDGTDEKSDDGEENYDNATLPEDLVMWVYQENLACVW